MTLAELASKTCISCIDTNAMTKREARSALRDLPGWTVTDGSVQREFRFKSYSAGLDFVYTVGRIAEEQDHPSDMVIRWRRVKLTFTTHAIKGLSMNDFIMAAKAEPQYWKYGSAVLRVTP